MPTADATLLPPPYVSDPSERRERRDPRERAADERGSARHLEDVGVEAVLGAMIEQKRRASQPSFAAIDVPPASDGPTSEGPASDVPASDPSRRTPTRSEVFLKAR